MEIKKAFKLYIEELQNKICNALESEDNSSTFSFDNWKRKEGGGGKSGIIENGDVFEKGGVNISEVYGVLPSVLQSNLGVDSNRFRAMGLSLVIHPKNPKVPTSHANIRYFELYDQNDNIVDQWFGGGMDLTPYFLFEEDSIHFHSVCKNVCDKYDSDFYSDYKKKCDEYFWNSHRNEARGIGGIFFDYLRSSKTMSIESYLDFAKDFGNSFIDAYLPIVKKRKEEKFNEEDKKWQELRRGRYVEFNLIHDRGTLFGLKSNGRTESILMSLPPVVRWDYNHKEETEQQKILVDILKNPKDWVK